MEQFEARPRAKPVIQQANVETVADTLKSLFVSFRPIDNEPMRIYFRQQIGREDIIVFVVLYDLTSLDEKALDAWEGALGVYEKIRVRVQTLDGDRLAWLYVLNAFEGGLPSARYLGIIADAAEAAGAPDDYVGDLRRRECRNIGP